MNRLFLVLMIFTLITCSMYDTGKSIEKGTPNYELATSFAEKVPALNPDDNMIILSTKDFDVTVGDVVDRIRKSFGNNVERVVKNPPASIIKLFKEVAQTIAYKEILLEAADNEDITVLFIPCVAPSVNAPNLLVSNNKTILAANVFVAALLAAVSSPPV